MRLILSSAAVIFTMLAVTPAQSHTYAPTVTMTVTTPDGQTQDVVAKESNVGWLKLKNGTEYQFRPTVMDEPFSKVTVAIFTADSTPVGEVQAVKGKPAVDSKTTPSFKIAIKSIELDKKKTS
jgi:predicted 3-demethylubiquinone-9 3-methyltransferase (glyoxalase superfamily)